MAGVIIVAKETDQVVWVPFKLASFVPSGELIAETVAMIHIHPAIICAPYGTSILKGFPFSIDTDSTKSH
ncbi:MAG: hypothetical protein ACI85U_000276 [Candidatus Promineifilaceae bacterium]|jgi:hypothetical protein